tara:strand:+ start:625 stop:795 length:171 start_codon:yes stop_codon:yes gene_type:complete
MKKIILFFLILTSCTSIKKDNFNNDVFFDDSLSFEKFKEKIIIYGKNSDFQNINKN